MDKHMSLDLAVIIKVWLTIFLMTDLNRSKKKTTLILK
jgi:hypothetical protein